MFPVVLLNAFGLLIVPYRPREFVVHQREHSLDIAIVQPVRCSLKMPPRNPRKSMLRTKGPSTELSCNCKETLAYRCQAAKSLILANLRKTKGIPPRIAFLPSNEASLLREDEMVDMGRKDSINSVRRCSKIFQP